LCNFSQEPVYMMEESPRLRARGSGHGQHQLAEVGVRDLVRFPHSGHIVPFLDTTM
jgi:hypothetical protein